MSPRRGHVPPRQAVRPNILVELWRRYAPGAYHPDDYPWPIPYEVGMRWSTARYLRRIHDLHTRTWWRSVLADLRDVALASALCVSLVVMASFLAYFLRWLP